MYELSRKSEYHAKAHKFYLGLANSDAGKVTEKQKKWLLRIAAEFKRQPTPKLVSKGTKRVKITTVYSGDNQETVREAVI